MAEVQRVVEEGGEGPTLVSLANVLIFLHPNKIVRLIWFILFSDDTSEETGSEIDDPPEGS